MTHRAQRLRRLFGPHSLRTRVLLATTVLLAAGLAGMGLTSIALMRGYLVGKADAQLQAFADVVASRPPPTNSQLQQQPGTPSRAPTADSLPSAFVIETLSSSGGVVDVRSAPLGEQGSPAAPVVPRNRIHADGEPFTEYGPGAHVWRVLVQPVTDGRYVAIAVNLDDAQTTVARLRWIALSVGLSALMLLTVSGLWLVRASLAPLTAIERTAEGIAGGDLARRLPQPSPRTEVGRLARTLNTMLSRIEEAYRARQAGEARARDSEERMRRFVADASHELRTPLTSIRGYAEFYMQQGDAADRSEVDRLVDRIHGEAARMGVLVDDLLLLARLDAHRPLSIEPVDLSSVVADAVHAARASYPSRQISIAAPEEPVVIAGDHDRLRQVVANLVNNAVQHTDPTVKVQVTVAVDDATGDAHLAVRDDGPGMAPEHASRVFQRFYRADPGRARATGGSGLGLAIVASIVEAHYGRVAVASTPGVGSTFHVWLPLLVDPGDASQSATDSQDTVIGL